MKISLPTDVKKILATLNKAGYEAYLVGGCVRDILLGKEVKDWDFTTDAKPEEIRKLFPDSFYDNKFGTVGIPISKLTTDLSAEACAKEDNQLTSIYEITTYRSESGYTDHRHPDKIVWGKTLEEDLKRRDFTINAMACDGAKIIDLFSGQKDLENKIIRCVGDANQRFQEDALRMIRAIRLATELHFVIDDDTFQAIGKKASLVTKISGERIRDELLKILSSKYPHDGIKLLKNSTLLAYILPELDKCFGVEQKSPQRHHIYDVGTHLIKSLEFCPSKNPLVRLGTLLHDVGKAVTYNKNPEGVITFYNHEIIGASIVRNIAYRLHLSKEEREKLYRLVRFHQFTVDERQTDSAVRRFITNIGKENIENMLALRIGDRLGGGARETSWRLELFKKRLVKVQQKPFSITDLKINGYDVMKLLNIGPGPHVGETLELLFNEVVEGKLKNEREKLLDRLKNITADLEKSLKF